MAKPAINFISQPLVVMNTPGGAATISWDDLASANADGYTIGIWDRKLLVKWLADNARLTKIVKNTGITRRIATHKN